MRKVLWIVGEIILGLYTNIYGKLFIELYVFIMDPSAVGNGPDAIRTHDLRHVKATSFQLDHGPLSLL
jgi:hypothetical protein